MFHTFFSDLYEKPNNDEFESVWEVIALGVRNTYIEKLATDQS